MPPRWPIAASMAGPTRTPAAAPGTPPIAARGLEEVFAGRGWFRGTVILTGWRWLAESHWAVHALPSGAFLLSHPRGAVHEGFAQFPQFPLPPPATVTQKGWRSGGRTGRLCAFTSTGRGARGAAQRPMKCCPAVLAERLVAEGESGPPTSCTAALPEDLPDRLRWIGSTM